MDTPPVKGITQWSNTMNANSFYLYLAGSWGLIYLIVTILLIYLIRQSIDKTYTVEKYLLKWKWRPISGVGYYGFWINYRNLKTQLKDIYTDEEIHRLCRWKLTEYIMSKQRMTKGDRELLKKLSQ